MWVIIIIVGIAIMWYFSWKKNEEERIRVEIAERKKVEKCEQKYNSLKQEVDNVYHNNAHVKWGTMMKQSTISDLISMRFYYDEVKDVSYISMNLDNSGTKALFEEKNGSFVLKQEEDPEDFGRTMTVTVLLIDAPSPSAIQSFNEMERLMPSLSSLPNITFGFGN